MQQSASVAFRVTLTIAAFVIYCTYIPSFAFLMGYTSVNPGTVVAVFFLVAIGAWAIFDRSHPARMTLTFAWAVLFVALNLLTLAIHGPGDEMYQRVAGALSLLALVWFCFTSRISAVAIQRFLFLFALVNLVVVGFDFLYPGYLAPIDTPFYNAGRGAGFFVNANKAGFAAVFTVIMLTLTERSRIVVATLLLCTAWVMLTLSRSAILAFLIVCVVAIATGKFKVRDFLVPMALGLAIGIGGVAYFLAEEREGIASIEERIEWLTAPTRVRDYAAEERTLAATGAVRAFSESPLWGHGFGSPNELYGLPPHNLYLGFGADYGILGVVALLGFFLAMYLDWRMAGSPERLRTPLYTWMAATAFLSVFFDEAIGVTQFMFTAAWIQLLIIETRVLTDRSHSVAHGTAT